jgi:hypothetical protein
MTQRHLQTEETDHSAPLPDTVVQVGTDGEAISASQSSEQAEQMETIGAALSQESQQFRRNILHGMVGLSLVGVLIASGNFWFGEGGWSSILPTSSLISCSLGMMLIFSLFMVRSSRKPRQRRRDMAAKLIEQSDVRSIGPLVDALHLDDGMTREVAIEALTGLLPRLKASDAALLNDAQRAKLCQILSLPVENPFYKDFRDLFRPANNRAVAFRVAILRAFEQVGDSKALAVVERLAKREAKTEGEKRIQEAAEACLPALQYRAEQERSSQTLLRAAMPSSAASETLLRAAAGTQDTAPEQLLRASEQRSR